ncbi:MAG: kelch repeat-containing protein [Planctomycetota bacterium]
MRPPVPFLLLLCPSALSAQEWVAVHPPALSGHSACFDWRTGDLAVFGGVSYAYNARVFDDLWRFDGQRWHTTPQDGPRPPGRMGASLVCDSLRGRLVLFGGTNETVNLDDTWEYDGSGWTRLDIDGPSPRTSAPAVFDLGRGRVVLVGGFASSRWATDAWEFDGAAWSEIGPVVIPSLALAPPSLVYDLVRGRTVAITRSLASSTAAETWEYDGVAWTQRVTPTAVPVRVGGGAIWYDAAAVRTKVLTALPDPTRPLEVWSYDGADWRVAAQPSDRAGLGGHPVHDPLRDMHYRIDTNEVRTLDSVDWSPTVLARTPAGSTRTPMIYDGARDRIVMLQESTAAVSTWEHDGERWHLAATAGPRGTSAFVYAPWLRRGVLFRSDLQSPALVGETWSWDGAEWARIPTAAAPRTRQHTAMAADTRRRRIVLFGGSDRGDTWEFDGATWRPGPPPSASTPPARSLHAMVYDPTRDRVVLHGGKAPDGQLPFLYGDTWAYRDGVWTQLPPQQQPVPVRAGHSMVFDPVRDRVVLFGGWHSSSTPYGYRETWVLRDDTWSRLLRTAEVLPADTHGQRTHGLVFDPRRGEPVLLGYALTGLRDDAPVASPLGTGCGTAAHAPPRLAALAGLEPALGGAVVLELTDLPGSPGAALLAIGDGIGRWGAAALPLDLDLPGATGCQLWIAPLLTQGLPHPGSAASLVLQVPADPQLAGRVFGAQALVFDAATAGGVAGLTNAVVLRPN